MGETTSESLVANSVFEGLGAAYTKLKTKFPQAGVKVYAQEGYRGAAETYGEFVLQPEMSDGTLMVASNTEPPECVLVRVKGVD